MGTLVCHSFLILSSPNGHLGCLYVLAIVNRLIVLNVNIGVCLCVCVCVCVCVCCVIIFLSFPISFLRFSV